MKILKNEEGIALLMVLVLSAISLAAMAAMLYMMTVRSDISGLRKGYNTAYEAAMGGADVVDNMIRSKSSLLSFSAFEETIRNIASKDDYFFPANAACEPTTVTTECTRNYDDRCISGNCTGMMTKLNMMTDCWSNACDRNLSIDPVNPFTYDFRFRLDNGLSLGDEDYKAYRVYMKIVDTTYGNAADAGPVEDVPCVNCPDPVPTAYLDSLYTIEMLSVRYDPNRPLQPQDERAKISLLYLY